MLKEKEDFGVGVDFLRREDDFGVLFMDALRADPCARIELGLMSPRTLPRGDSSRDMLPKSRAGTPVSRKFMVLVEK
jgi:hypothetical protein